MLNDHIVLFGRTKLGSLPYGRSGVMLYGTTVRCTCKEFEDRVNIAPSKGGQQSAFELWLDHIKELLDVLKKDGAFWTSTGWSIRRSIFCEFKGITTGFSCSRRATRRFGRSYEPSKILCCTQHARLLGDTSA
jgi:hypothetical protein